ncbi:MAG: hypothetical protein JNM75_03720 [Rhodospirillales bacterium]|nr:hypothetical protein [Rhodospirillales bacterium]
MSRRKRPAKSLTTRLTAGPDMLVEPIYEPDPDGRAVVHRSTVDTIGIMLRSGTITEEMHDAARAFEAVFSRAQFDPIVCMTLDRLPGSGSAADFTDAQLDARRRVGDALDALGGLGSPAGSCVWHVVGLQRSIREWALRQGWGGRPVRVEQAQGILIAALGVLAGWYGYGDDDRTAVAKRCRESLRQRAG